MFDGYALIPFSFIYCLLDQSANCYARLPICTEYILMNIDLLDHICLKIDVAMTHAAKYPLLIYYKPPQSSPYHHYYHTQNPH